MAGDYMTVIITNSDNDICSEKRYPLDLTVFDLKCRLELITGIPVSSCRLQLKSRNLDQILRDFIDDSSTLRSLGAQDGMIMHVINTAPPNTAVVGKEVKQFVLPEEDYEKRPDSVRKWKQQLKLGRFDPDRRVKPETQEVLDSRIKVGNRCEVTLRQQLPKRGVIAYYGKTDFKPGLWVGVHFDEPVGKHDGTVDGKTYFTCPLKYGSFVRPDTVTIGDFPEEF